MEDSKGSTSEQWNRFEKLFEVQVADSAWLLVETHRFVFLNNKPYFNKKVQPHCCIGEGFELLTTPCSVG